MKTIRDIAKEAETSPGTVDRVLHNRGGVSKKTKEKIQAVLNKYDFQKNIMASTLAFKKNYKIATLTPQSTSKKDFWYEPNRGIQTAIEEIKKYGVTVDCFYFDSFDSKSFLDAFNSILSLKPNAVLLAPVFYKNSIRLVRLLEKNNIPYLFINIDIGDLQNMTFIGQNSYQSGFLSGKLLKLILSEQDTILIIKSRKNMDRHHAIDLRVKGFLDYFKSKEPLRTMRFLNIENFRSGELVKRLTVEFDTTAIAGGVFVPSSHVYKVAEFLESVHLSSIKLIGYDTHVENIKYLKNETIDFLIDQEPFEQGYKGIKILFEYLLFNKMPKKIYDSPINIMTKENLRACH